MMTFPDYYPNGCPIEPYDSKPGIYYRAIGRLNRLKKHDFFSSDVKNHRLISECDQCAISIFSDIEDLKHTLVNHPDMPQHIVELTIPDNSGVIHQRPNLDGDSHHDWWICNEIDPLCLDHKIFQGGLNV